MAVSASAQSPAAPQAGLGGNPVPGVCLLSREAIIANAAIGKAATARLNQIAAQAQAEIDAERKPHATELQAFRSEAAKPSPDQRKNRRAACRPRDRQDG